MNNIVISEQLFVEIVELLEKVSSNITTFYTAGATSFIRSPFKTAKNCIKIFMTELANECHEMALTMFDETAEQWQYREAVKDSE